LRLRVDFRERVHVPYRADLREKGAADEQETTGAADEQETTHMPQADAR